MPRNSTRITWKEHCGDHVVSRNAGKPSGKLKITRMSLIIIINLEISYQDRKIFGHVK